MFTTEVRQTACFKAVSYLMHLPNMTGQQRMINPPWYLILPLLLFKKSVFALLLFLIFYTVRFHHMSLIFLILTKRIFLEILLKIHNHFNYSNYKIQFTV